MLAVAKTEENVPGAIWIGIYNENFDPLIADRRIAGDGRSVVATLWNGSEFAVFYRTLNQGMNLQRVSTSGEPLGTPVPVTPSRPVFFADEIDVTWSPALNAYVVARAVSQGLGEGVWITVIERDGTERLDRLASAIAAAQSQLDLAVSDSGVIGAFFITSNGGLAFARLAPGESFVAVRTVASGGTDVQAASQNGLFVVTRAVFENGQTVIRWFVLDSSQQIVRPDAVLLTPQGDDAYPAALVAADGELALAYLNVARRAQPEPIYRLRRFRIDGTLLSDTEFAPASSATARAISPHTFVWTGRSYISAPVRSASDRLNSFLVRFCPLRASIMTPARTAVRIGDPITFSATASGGLPAYEYSWIFPGEIGAKTGQALDRTFARPGTYTVTLLVTDATGTQVQQTITIVAGRPKQRAVRH